MVRRGILLTAAASALATDQETHVVAENRCDDRGDDDVPQRQPPEVRKRGSSEQRRLARHRQSGVFKEDAREHDGVAVAGEQIDNPGGQSNELVGSR